MSSSRRRFLQTSMASSTLVAMGATTVPEFLGRSARAAGAVKPNDRVLVVVQLLGGNDGLNTVVPHGIDGYNRGRRTLRIGSSQVHKVAAEVGLHPAMGGMSKLLEKGRLAIVQGVGYPNPDRSHFRSMEIWETGRLDGDAKALETGWLGRALDLKGRKPGEDPLAMHVGGRSMPQALRSLKSEVPALESLESFKLRLTGSDSERKAERSALNEVAAAERKMDDPLLGFIRQTTLSAYESSSRLEHVAPKAGGPKYPNFGLARRLELVAQMIKAGFGTRIFYTSLDGFDTHANQLGTHAALLTELSDSFGAFDDDLSAAGQADRVVVLAFSEFGRRVAENASLGTDHGAAAPVFVVGPVARPGLVGNHPSFDDLDDGDLKYHTDFRRVYASLLTDWLDCPAQTVVGAGFPHLPLLRKA
jgi:uncharacterized protein (DUF1501 family)